MLSVWACGLIAENGWSDWAWVAYGYRTYVNVNISNIPQNNCQLDYNNLSTTMINASGISKTACLNRLHVDFVCLHYSCKWFCWLFTFHFRTSQCTQEMKRMAIIFKWKWNVSQKIHKNKDNAMIVYFEHWQRWLWVYVFYDKLLIFVNENIFFRSLVFGLVILLQWISLLLCAHEIWHQKLHKVLMFN